MGITVDVPSPPKPPTSGGSGGSSSSGSSGGSGGRTYRRSSGSSSGRDTSPYIQIYRAKMDSPGAKPPSGLLAKAVANNWSTAYFWYMVRRTDKNYFKSPEAKKRAIEFKDTWKAVMPSAKVNNKSLIAYLKSGQDINTWFRTQVAKSGTFRKQNPYYNAFVKAQQGAGSASLANPMLYAKYREAFRSAYEQAGVKPPTGFEQMYFKSGITPEQFSENLRLVGATSGAYEWQHGAPVDQAQALFNQKGAGQLRTRLQKALATQASFFGSSQPGFQMEKKDQFITSSI